MRLRLNNRLAVKLAVQMIVVAVIISALFYVIIYIQTREMQKRIFDKAGLFSSILGANLDKIVGDNLEAYYKLQEATLALAKDEQGIEELRVIAPEYVILSARSGKGIWQPVEKKYLSLLGDVAKTGQTRSIAKTALGNELVIHFMPLFSKDPVQPQLIGIMQVIARFPSKQSSAIAYLRANMNAYFKNKAADFADNLAQSLQDVLNESQRNFNYLESLINNMLADKEIEDVKLFSKDLRMLGSGTSGRRRNFVTNERSAIYMKAMQKQAMLTSNVKDSSQLVEVVSPLYLTQDGRRQIGGAVGIVVSLSQVRGLIAARRNNILLMSLIITAVFCLLIGLFFRRVVIRPIGELINLAERVGHGDFSKRARVRSGDEIGRLTEAFNQMCSELNNSKQEIELWNLKLQERVDKVTRELKTKQAQLIESEKMASLGVLSSGIAHEINNPLGIILGHTQMLLKEFRTKGQVQDPVEARQLLESVEENTKRCSHIVKSLLQFAKKKKSQLQEANIVEAIENTLIFTNSRLVKKGIKVIRDFMPAPPVIMADPVQLEQVFINIILNAEQSISDDSGGEIKITTNIQGDGSGKGKCLAITFQDNGSGISREFLGRIFDPFFSTKETGEGAGLGLSVSYGIIRAHGGNIEAKSQMGIGTSIIVKLPIKM